MNLQIRDLINEARSVSQSLILPSFRNIDRGDVETKSRPDDLVTQIDREVEAELTHRLNRLSPNTHIFGEEAISDDPSLFNKLKADEACILIDPIDGTWNFANGIAIFGLIVGFIENGQCSAAMLYDPIGDDWCVAEQGKGAYFGRPGKPEKRLFVDTPTDSLDRTIGTAGLKLFPENMRSSIERLQSHWVRNVWFGCSCHEYRLMAQASSAVSVSWNPKPWDHAAGCLLIEEAGGVCRMLDRTGYGPSCTSGVLIAAATEEIWEATAKRF